LCIATGVDPGGGEALGAEALHISILTTAKPSAALNGGTIIFLKPYMVNVLVKKLVDCSTGVS